jgi:alcohol dehydrogenase
MRAVQYSTFGGPLTVVDSLDPACPPGGAVIKVEATGVCRSDWHAWRGHEPVVLPHIGGHEYAGTVVDIASDVASFGVGDRVTVPFVCGCGTCEYCVAGDAQVCPNQTQPGFSGPGSFAEFVAVPGAATNLVRLPDGIESTAAASLGCRFATAFRAVTAHGRLESGQWLAVHGCGGVGLSAVMIGAALGARVIAIDVSSAALDRAVALGAEIRVDASQGGDLGRAVRDLTDGGAHVSVDALGSPATAGNSVRSLRRRGRHVQVGLLLGDDARAPLPMARVIAWELEIYGSHGMSAAAYPALLGLVAAGSLHPELLVGRTVGLDGIGDALAAMDPPSPGVSVDSPAASRPAPGITVAVL